MRKHSLDTMNLIGIIARHRNYPEIRKVHNLLHLRVPPYVTITENKGQHFQPGVNLHYLIFFLPNK